MVCPPHRGDVWMLALLLSISTFKVPVWGLNVTHHSLYITWVVDRRKTCASTIPPIINWNITSVFPIIICLLNLPSPPSCIVSQQTQKLTHTKHIWLLLPLNVFLHLSLFSNFLQANSSYSKKNPYDWECHREGERFPHTDCALCIV